MSAPRNLGEQLVEALRDARGDDGSILSNFSAFAVGYLEGIINDVALQSPKARETVEWHIARQREKARSAAA